MARQYEKRYRLSETDDVLMKLRAILQDVDQRIDAVEIVKEAFEKGNRIDIEALLKALDEDISYKSAAMQELIDEIGDGFTPDRISETVDKRFTSNAEQQAHVDGLAEANNRINARATSAALGVHTAATNNPHGVTAAQVGTLTTAEIDADLELLEALILGTASPAADTLGKIEALLAKHLRGDAAQAFSAAEKQQARANADASHALHFVRGLILSNNAVDAVNDIDISTGAAQNAAVLYVENLAVVTKRLDAAWSAGTGGGGLDAGAKANSQTYHVHALRKQSDGSFDALFSLSATAPTVPPGYDLIQRLGSVCTKSDGSIRRFIQRANHFNWAEAVTVDDFTVTTSLPYGDYTFTYLPRGVDLLVRVRMVVLGPGSGSADATFFPLNALDNSSGYVDNAYISSPINNQTSLLVMVSSDGSAKMALGIAGGSITTSISVRGWEDFTVPRIGG